MRQRLIERITKVVASATKKLAKAQVRYKANYDKTIRPAQPLTVGQAVFVRREPRAEDRLLPSQKLRRKVDGPYEVLKVRSHTVTISWDGLLNTVSKGRVTRAPQEPNEVISDIQAVADDALDDAIPEEEINPPLQDVEADKSQMGVQEPEPTAGEEPPENASVHVTASGDPEDEIERLVAYRPGNGFCVRWAGFDATYDSWHQPKDLPYDAMVYYFLCMGKPMPPSILWFKPRNQMALQRRHPTTTEGLHHKSLPTTVPKG